MGFGSRIRLGHLKIFPDHHRAFSTDVILCAKVAVDLCESRGGTDSGAESEESGQIAHSYGLRPFWTSINNRGLLDPQAFFLHTNKSVSTPQLRTVENHARREQL